MEFLSNDTKNKLPNERDRVQFKNFYLSFYIIAKDLVHSYQLFFFKSHLLLKALFYYFLLFQSDFALLAK